nr:two-component regulator propeller domain-containing protein [Paraflavitalea speifideiaquila]
MTSIVRDHQNNVWMATYGGGINRFNKHTRSFEHYNCTYPGYSYGDRNVWKLLEDSQHNLWAGAIASGRLFRYDRTTNQFESFDEKLVDVITLAEDRKGQLWAGTFNSLIKVDVQHRQHRFFPMRNAVRSIYEDKAGNCWWVQKAMACYCSTGKKGLSKHTLNRRAFPAIPCLIRSKTMLAIFGSARSTVFQSSHLLQVLSGISLCRMACRAINLITMQPFA